MNQPPHRPAHRSPPARQRCAPLSPQPPTAREDIFLEPHYAPGIQQLFLEEPEPDLSPRPTRR